MVTAWRWDRDDQLPDGRYWGIEGINQVRVALDRYGLGTSAFGDSASVVAFAFVADPFALCGDVERRLVEDDVPALSVAVLCGSELACRTWGARTFDGDAINRRTLFQAGSVSKPVTAVGVLRLVAEGALDLDADVNEYLTTWKVPSVGRSQERVTLRQLLTHTAGLTVPGFPGYARDARLPTLEQILDGVAPANTEAVRVATQPGIAWQYSGGGTTVVQAAMVDVTGEAFSDLMRRLVLEPCGMSDATFEQPLPDDRHGREAIGHRDHTSVPGGWHVYPEMAAAGLWCSPTDLMHFVREVNRAVAGESASDPAEGTRRAPGDPDHGCASRRRHGDRLPPRRTGSPSQLLPRRHR